MSVPPPPNQWGSQQPTGNQPAGVPQWGPPPGGQPQWGPPPGPPPSGGGKGKWIFGGIALLAVIAVTVVITVLVVGKDSGGNSPTPTSTSAPASDIASANDKGPATIITEDPTCAATTPILQTLSDVQRNGWDKRDPSIPASSWIPDVRAQFLAVGQGMRSAADQMVALAKRTPHRVMRELYQQLIAYARGYADRIPTYSPRDDNLAIAAVTTGNAIGDMCAAVGYGSAPARAPLLEPSETQSQVAPVGDPENPQRFLAGPNPTCTEWSTALSEFQTATANWRSIPSGIPASRWTPEQREINEAVAPVMNASADKLQALGEHSGNLTWQDFADLSAQYRRAVARSLPSYVAADNYLANASLELSGVVQAACQAVGSS